MSPIRRFRCNLLAVEITPMTVQGLVDSLEGSLKSCTGLVVAGHNLHSVYLAHTDANLQSFYASASVVLPDGAPVLWDYRMSGHREKCERIGSTDWIPNLARLSSLRSIYVVGASELSNRRCLEALRSIAPGVEVAGTPGSNWSEPRSQQVLEELEAAAPDMVLIGLGMPIQEQFACDVARILPTSIIATVGGAIDQLAGVQPNAPRWLGKFGVEWLWRLATQPSRLWRRYLLEPWKLLLVRATQVAGR